MFVFGLKSATVGLSETLLDHYWPIFSTVAPNSGALVSYFAELAAVLSAAQIEFATEQ